METTCQASYPLNSENASPPGTFKAYLSWADMALPPKALTSAVTIAIDRKSTRLNSSHSQISYAVFCLKKKNGYSPRIRHRLLAVSQSVSAPVALPRHHL